MRNILGIIAVFLFVASTASANDKGSARISSDTNQKVYVDLSDITIDHSGIWVYEGGSILPISSLGFDQGGYYYNAKDFWLCPRCRKKNPNSAPICQSCKWPLYDDNRIHR